MGIDSAAYVILDLERSGGIAGLAERGQLFLDGHVLLERRNQEPMVFQLSPAEQAQLSVVLDAAHFYRNAAQTEPPAKAIPDAFEYRIRRRGVLLQGEVFTQDGAAPAWLQPLLPLLTNLLLTPDPTRLQPLPPPAAAVTSTAVLSQAVVAPSAACAGHRGAGVRAQPARRRAACAGQPGSQLQHCWRGQGGGRRADVWRWRR